MSAFTLVISFIVFDFVHIVSCWCQLYLYSNTGLSGTRYGPYDVGCIAFDGTGNFPNDDIDSAQLSSNSAYSCTAVFGASCGCGTGELKQFTTVNPHSTTQIPSFSFGQNVLSCIMLSVNTPQPTTANPTTSNPSYNPSYNPTTEPTTEPTSVPTSNPSFNPTKTTLYPTKIPTFNPILYKNGQSAETDMETTETTFSHTTNNPTMILIDQSNQNDTYDNSNIININNIPFIIVFILVIITIIAYMDATCFRVNDFFKLGALIIASMHLLDIIYDCLFAFKIAESEYAVLLLFCIAFIIIPMVVTLYQLHTDINKWKRSDVLSEWLSNNVTLLYMISSICGSAFTAVQLCTSNLFNLTQFDMPLSRIQFNKFQTKRVFSVVLLENIPQLAIQIVYLSISNANTNNIVFISMGFSVLSIIISIFSMVAQRNITRSRDYVSIQYNVTGISIIGQTHKHRNKIKQIRNHISSILGINRELIEIQRPIEIPKGLEIHVNIYVNHTKAIDTNFEKVIHESQRSGELGEIMKNAWSLSSVPLINNIKYEKYESKERRDQTVMIQANKSFDIPNNVEIAMSKVMSHSDMSVEYGNEVQVLPPRIAPVTITAGEFGKDSDNESNTGEQSYNKETTKGNDATYKDYNVTAGINQNNDMDIVNEINETTTNGTRNDEPM
eukprot:305604_1